MIRVLIVDDSPIAVEVLRRIFALDPSFQVVGVANDGSQAVELARALRPDVITMDIGMPRMNGFEATRRIMAENPTPIVVVAASANAIDGELGFDALRLGAVDLIDKPGGVVDGLEAIAVDFHRRIRVASRVRPITHARRVDRTKAHAPRAGDTAHGIVAIGASTGGPLALEFVLAGLPASFSLPIVVVQHMSKRFTAGLVRWLATTTGREVVLATDRTVIRPAVVYIGPEDAHLTVRNGGLLQLGSGEPVEGMRPSVDVLFESVATVYGERAIGVLLTGMGRDGAAGLRRIRDNKGTTVVQDERSCAVFGMPRAALAIGAADVGTPLAEIAGAIANAARTRR